MKTRKILSLALVGLMSISVCSAVRCEGEISHFAGVKVLAKNLSNPAGFVVCGAFSWLAFFATAYKFIHLSLPYGSRNIKIRKRIKAGKRKKAIVIGGSSILVGIGGMFYCGANTLKQWGFL